MGDNLYDAALAAIMKLFNDKNVSQEEAIANLSALKDEINILIDSLEG